MVADSIIAPECTYFIEGNSIVTDGTIKRKVSGTSLAGILGESPWSSPFQVACNLLGVARKDISKKPAVKAGQILEPRIIEYVKSKYSGIGLFLGADEVYDKREGNHDSWKSDFESDVFSGHVDGIVMKDDGSEYIFEVKTSINMDAWVEGVPKYYYWQVALYNYFITKKDHAYIALGIVTQDTYKDANSWMPNENTVLLFDSIKFNNEEVEMVLEKVKEWYHTYIENGITPPYDPNIPEDVELFEHLVSLDSSSEAIKDIITEISALSDKLDEEKAKTKYISDRYETLKKQVKEYMDVHNISQMSTALGDYKVTLSESVTSTVSKELLEIAGIDPAPYIVTTVSKIFRIKKVKGV